MTLEGEVGRGLACVTISSLGEKLGEETATKNDENIQVKLPWHLHHHVSKVGF